MTAEQIEEVASAIAVKTVERIKKLERESPIVRNLFITAIQVDLKDDVKNALNRASSRKGK